MDKDLEMITSHNKGAYIIPRVYLDCPQWWEKENKSELSLDAKGRPMRQSYASDKWREDALSAIYALIDHISSSQWDENVIGYQVAAGLTEEWQYHHTYPYQYLDYSNCNLKNFREWLRNKYESISDLNREWNTVYKDYENIVSQSLWKAVFKRGVERPKRKACYRLLYIPQPQWQIQYCFLWKIRNTPIMKD